MALAELSLQDLRCIQAAELSFQPGSNLLYGANGAGKTSVLEAVFLLGRGRSFRTRLNEKLIRHGQPQLRVVGRSQSGPLQHTLGVEVARDGGTRARLDAQSVRSLADLATAFPVQVLDPDAHRLIEDSATRRRRWLDWAVFHVEPGFAATWARYSRALQQRNAALRSGQGDLRIWDRELIQDGERLSAARERVLGCLQPYWEDVSQTLLDEGLTLGFQAGWDRDLGLAEALAGAGSRDRLRKTTTVGPHRADVAIRIRGKPVREVLSRGQQKLAAVALTLCQLEFLKQEHQVLPTLLLDDPSAELDRGRLDRFIDRVKALQTQLIVTALDRDFGLFGTPDAVFHVEHGRVTPG
ncbi:MAG: DNA replication/repair protein RecF [Steroidobacteraceae bacterium]|jgi:DNA replication and repair protein RecF|nr:DNA replication/repair protein RecF [Steroidobacteraceae bacterium]